MVNFLSSINFVKPDQSFTIGSMTWVINADGNGEIMETVQDNPAPNVLALAPTAPTSAPRRAWRSIDQDDLIASVDQVTNGLAECLSLV